MALNQIGLGMLFTATDLASGVMGKIRNGFNQTADGAGKFSASSKSAFKEFGLGLGIMTAGIAGLAMLDPALKAAGEFGAAIAETSTLIDEATFPVAEMNRLTMGLAATYGKMAPEEVKALYQGISAGASDASKATGLLNAANKLAIGGVTDVKTSVDGLTNVLNSYGIAYESATDVSDAFFVAIKAGKTTVAELASTVGRLAPTAGAVGVGFEQMLAAVSAVTTKGLKTEEAINGLKAALSNVIKPTSDAVAEAKRLGIEFTAESLRAKGLPKFLNDITTSSKFNADSMSKLFGSIEGLNSILALTANGSATFTDILGSMAKRTGETDRAFEKMANTSKFQGERFDALKNNALILIGQAISPFKVAILKAANAILDGFGKIPAPMRDMAVKLFALASAAMVVVGGFLAAKAGIAILLVGLKFAGVTIGGIVAALAPVIIVLGLATLAVYAFHAAIEKNIGGIGDTWANMVEGAKLGFGAISQLLTQGGFSGEIREALSKPGNEGIRAFAISVFMWTERIKEFFRGMGDGFNDSIDAMGPTIDNLLRALKDLGTAFGFVQETPDAAAASFDSFGATGVKVGAAIGKVAEIMISGMAAVTDMVTGATNAWKLLSDVFAPLGEAFSEVGASLQGILADLGIVNAGAGSGASVWKALGGIFLNVVVGAIRIAITEIRMFADHLRNAATTVGGVIDIIGGLFSGNWERVWYGAKRVVFGVIMTIVDIIGSVGQVVAEMIDSIGRLFGKDTGLSKGLREFREGFRSDVQSGFGLGSSTTGGATPTPVTAASTFMPGAPSTSTSPAVTMASVQGSLPQSVDPAAIEAAAAAAASQAVSKVPPPNFTATMLVDGEKLGEISVKSNAAKNARSFTPVSVTAE